MPGITVTVINKEDVGLSEIVNADVQLGDNYPTGGEPIDPAAFRFRVGNTVHSAQITNTGGYLYGFRVDGDGDAFLQVYEETGNSGKLKEVNNGTDLSAETVRVTAFGR